MILKLITLYRLFTMYGSWGMEHDGDNFLSFWTIFCDLIPLKTQKIKILNKMKKTPGDNILHKCTKNHDHILLCPWDTMHDGCNSYFLLFAIFSQKHKNDHKLTQFISDFANFLPQFCHKNITKQ